MAHEITIVDCVDEREETRGGLDGLVRVRYRTRRIACDTPVLGMGAGIGCRVSSRSYCVHKDSILSILGELLCQRLPC